MIPGESITQEDSQLIESRSQSVRCLALIDIIFAFMYMLLSPFFAVSALISFMFAFCGYQGSKNYNKTQVLYYVSFLVVQNIFRIAIFITCLVNPSAFGIDELSNNSIVLNIISILINLYINYFIYSFYSLLNRYSQEALLALRADPQIIVVHGSLV